LSQRIEYPHTVAVTGMARSGTTMMATLLDAHPDIAMCYDVMPPIVETPLPEVIREFEETIAGFDRTALEDVNAKETYDVLREALKATPLKSVHWAVTVCRASGLSVYDLLDALKDAAEDSMERIATNDDRLSVGRRLIELKLARSPGKSLPGLKFVMDPEVPQRVLHRPKFVIIIRDPRGFASSHMRLKWETDASRLAKRWNSLSGRIRHMITSDVYDTYCLRFEDIITDPVPIVADLNRFLGVREDDFVTDFSTRSSVFKVRDAFNSSMQKFWDGELSSSRIDAWKDIVSRREQRTIVESCADNMEFFGYR